MPSYILYRIIRTLCAIACGICFTLRVEGKDNLPKDSSFIVASNHKSYLDPIVVALTIPRPAHFMAREDLFNIKFLGTLLKNMGVFPVRRNYQDLRAMKTALKSLKEGGIIAIFPEGARIEGAGFGEPELGVGMLAAHSGVPVVPVFIEGSEKALPKRARFIKCNPIVAHIGKPLKFEKSKDISDKKESYRRFADRIMENIAFLKKSYENKN